GAEFHFDAAGVAGNRLVHRVVDDFGEQVMKRVGVGAPDVHPWPTAHRLQALQHLDVGGRIATGGTRIIGLLFGRQVGEHVGGGSVGAAGHGAVVSVES